MFILAGIIPVVLLIGVGLAGLLWLRRGRRVIGIEPHCAACGYIVHGLPTPTCPECGADLSQPKAIVTTGRLPAGRLARSIAWSIFCLLAVVIPIGFVWEDFVMPAMPQVRDNSQQVMLLTPGSKGYRSIAAIAHTHDWVYPHGPDPRPGDLKIELTRSDGTVRVLVLDSATLHFREASAPGSTMSPTPLDADALVAWLRSFAVQGETDELHKEMASAMTQVQQLVSQRDALKAGIGTSVGFSGVSGSTGGSTNPLPWAGLVPLSIGAIVWGIGMILIVRKPSTARGDSHMIA